VTISRRGFLLGGGVVGVAAAAGTYGLIQEGVLPGRIRLNDLLGANEPPPPVPGAVPGRLVTGSFESKARGTTVGWTIAYPPGATEDAELPVCIAMHGRDGDNHWMFEGLSLQYFLASAVEGGGLPPFAIASVDGGAATNWHPRANGDNPQAMVVDEFLPMLSDRGLRTKGIGLWGWSLGGYGALLLASELGAQRVAAVVASSPALWRAPEETAPDVFDDPADFERNNVYTRGAAFAGIPLRIDIGDNDSFTPAVEAFIDDLPVRAAGGVTRGLHDTAYWMRVAPAEIAFLAQHLVAS